MNSFFRFVRYQTNRFFFRKRNFLSLCLCIKDDARHIEEWLAYHLTIGVSHFYIYDNGSTDDLKKVLAPYIAKRVVTYEFYPTHPGQILAYIDCAKRYHKSTEWMGFIDGDEFISSDAIVDILKQTTGVGIALNWKVFGSSGHIAQPSGLQIEEYKMCANKNHPINKHLKIIVRPNKIIKFLDPHQALFVNKEQVSTLAGEKISSAFSSVVVHDPVCINHYMIRSKEECLKKIARGRATIKAFRPENYFETQDVNDIRDYGMDKYVAKTKETIVYFRNYLPTQ